VGPSTVSVSGTWARACRLGATLEPLHAIVLAIVQGLSEFLPISSSGHLVLVPYLLGWQDQGLAFDVAVHVGTLFAVVAYFRRELLAMARAWFGSFAGGGLTPDARLAWCVLIGTIPVGLVGLAFGGLIEEKLRNPLAVATLLALFGALMWIADRFGRAARDEYSVGWRDAILIGCAQALALMPGTSRSGVTMTMARTLGLTREAAARFSFLLAVPGIGMAGGYELLKLVTSEDRSVDWGMMTLGVGVAAVTGYLCIAWLLRVINRIGLAPFALYRFAVAAVLFWLFA
jgi:undecaprenyl-diphosphatase